MARAGLQLSVRDVAAAAGLSPNTITRVGAGDAQQVAAAVAVLNVEEATDPPHR